MHYQFLLILSICNQRQQVLGPFKICSQSLTCSLVVEQETLWHKTNNGNYNFTSLLKPFCSSCFKVFLTLQQVFLYHAQGPTGNKNSQFNFLFNGKRPHSLFSNLPDIRSHCIILSSPWFCWVNCFTIYFKPLSHLKKPFLKGRCYRALFSWTDVQQEVSTTTE